MVIRTKVSQKDFIKERQKAKTIDLQRARAARARLTRAGTSFLTIQTRARALARLAKALTRGAASRTGMMASSSSM